MNLLSKQTCLLVALLSAVAGWPHADAKDAAIKPIPLTGWNADVVYENASPTAASSFDRLNQAQPDSSLYAWFEAGLDGHSDGLPSSRKIISAADTNVVFELQPYNTNNVLLLSGAKSSGKLVLREPSSYAALFILAAAGGGEAALTLQLRFADGNESDPIACPVPDWFTGAESKLTKAPAISGLGRSNGKQGFEYEEHGDDAFGLYQTRIDLKKLGCDGKTIESITFKKGSGGSTAGVFAITGEQSHPSK
jgi:hypothetical protein